MRICRSFALLAAVPIALGPAHLHAHEPEVGPPPRTEPEPLPPGPLSPETTETAPALPAETLEADASQPPRDSAEEATPERYAPAAPSAVPATSPGQADLPYPNGIVVDRPYPAPPPELQRRTGMMVAGIVLMGVGAVGAITGAGLMGDVEERNDCRDDHLLRCDLGTADRRQRDIGIAVGLVGLGLIGAGIPLTVVGARRVPVQSTAEIDLGVTGGRVRLRF